MARNQFPNFGGGNMQQLMRQAQKMQEQLTKAQEELDAKEYEAIESTFNEDERYMTVTYLLDDDRNSLKGAASEFPEGCVSVPAPSLMCKLAVVT